MIILLLQEIMYRTLRMLHPSIQDLFYNGVQVASRLTRIDKAEFSLRNEELSISRSAEILMGFHYFDILQ